MQYRKFPKIDKDISVLGFGCMRLPLKDPNEAANKKGGNERAGASTDHSAAVKPIDSQYIDFPRAKQMVRTAIDQGVNYIDTAWPYHKEKSEPFLAEALAEGYREKIYLATKLPIWLLKTEADMDYFLDEQLRRLNTSYIDFYLLHSLDKDRWALLKKLNVFSFLEEALKQGKIKHIGFSFHGDLDTFKTIIDEYPWEFCQIQYNFLDTHMQAGTEGLEYAYQKNVGIIVMEPLRGGALTESIPQEIMALWQGAPVKRKPAAWALHWLWHDPRITLVLSGMTTEEHVEENIKTAAEGSPNLLSEKELTIINKVKRVYQERIKVPCTRCNYCMPCPHGVNISGAFQLYNDAFMLNNHAQYKEAYQFILANSKASLCQECGECEPKCPQHIPIIESLKEVAQSFE